MTSKSYLAMVATLVLHTATVNRSVQATLVSSDNCYQRNFGKNKIVCVCNQQSCPTIGQFDNPAQDQVNVYQSNQNGLRLKKSVLTENDLSVDKHAKSSQSLTIKLNPQVTYQEIIGFGGAFTDSTGINIKSLPSELAEQIMKDYFSKDGLEYTMGRVPIGGSDFSTRPYSYDDDHPEDLNLTHFRLAEEDFEYKIPLIKQAFEYNRDLRLFASAWSPPGWMKTSGSVWKKGELKGDTDGPYYKAWAQYHVKFLEAYKQEGVNFWGLTTGNEPIHGLVFSLFNNLGFTPSQSRDFIKKHLGPELEKAGYWPNLKIMMLDDQLILAPVWLPKVLDDPEAAKYISGVGIHWYLNNFLGRIFQDKLQKKYPSVFWLGTEACEGFRPILDSQKVSLGEWGRAESYASDIIEDLNHFTAGWVDWNMALDLNGGPNWAKNFVDSPIIVNATANEYYRQPMYYALAHFTKFLKPGSTRIDSSANQGGVSFTAFQTPNNEMVLIVLNTKNYEKTLKIQGGFSFDPEWTLAPRSLTTFVGKI